MVGVVAAAIPILAFFMLKDREKYAGALTRILISYSTVHGVVKVCNLRDRVRKLFDVVITDHSMPRLTGVALACRTGVTVACQV